MARRQQLQEEVAAAVAAFLPPTALRTLPVPLHQHLLGEPDADPDNDDRDSRPALPVRPLAAAAAAAAAAVAATLQPDNAAEQETLPTGGSDAGAGAMAGANLTRARALRVAAVPPRRRQATAQPRPSISEHLGLTAAVRADLAAPGLLHGCVLVGVRPPASPLWQTTVSGLRVAAGGREHCASCTAVWQSGYWGELAFQLAGQRAAARTLRVLVLAYHQLSLDSVCLDAPARGDGADPAPELFLLDSKKGAGKFPGWQLLALRESAEGAAGGADGPEYGLVVRLLRRFGSATDASRTPLNVTSNTRLVVELAAAIAGSTGAFATLVD